MKNKSKKTKALTMEVNKARWYILTFWGEQRQTQEYRIQANVD